MKNTNDNIVVAKLDEVSDLLKHLLALELYRSGVSKAAIGKHLHLAKSTVVKMLKGIRED